MNLQRLILLTFLFLFGACTNKSEKKESSVMQEKSHKVEKVKARTANQALLDGKLNVFIPEEFTKVTEMELIKQFPNERQRPTVIFQESKQVKLAINYGSSPATQKDLPQIKLAF